MNMLTPMLSASRDWYLDQLGIQQYEPRNSHLFYGGSVLTLSDAIALIIIGEDLSLETPFIKDVLASIDLDPGAFVIIPPSKSALLPDNINQVIWSLSSLSDIDLKKKSPALIQTPPLQELVVSPKDKHCLWEQLCNYVHYFKT